MTSGLLKDTSENEYSALQYIMCLLLRVPARPSGGQSSATHTFVHRNCITAMPTPSRPCFRNDESAIHVESDNMLCSALGADHRPTILTNPDSVCNGQASLLRRSCFMLSTSATSRWRRHEICLVPHLTTWFGSTKLFISTVVRPTQARV